MVIYEENTKRIVVPSGLGNLTGLMEAEAQAMYNSGRTDGYNEGIEDGKSMQDRKLTDSVTFNENGEYDADYGYKKVIVDVDNQWDEGYESGYTDGYASGSTDRSEAIENAFESGYTNGYTEGYESGFTDGIVSATTIPVEFVLVYNFDDPDTMHPLRALDFKLNGHSVEYEYDAASHLYWAYVHAKVSLYEVSVITSVTIDFVTHVPYEESSSSMTYKAITINGTDRNIISYSLTSINQGADYRIEYTIEPVPISEFQIGYASGYTNGYASGYTDGQASCPECSGSTDCSSAITDAYESGYTDGYASGYTDGQAGYKLGTYISMPMPNDLYGTIYTKSFNDESHSPNIVGWGALHLDLGQIIYYGKNKQKALMTSGTIVSNGTYTMEDGWNKIVVDVPQGESKGPLYSIFLSFAGHPTLSSLPTDWKVNGFDFIVTSGYTNISTYTLIGVDGYLDNGVSLITPTVITFKVPTTDYEQWSESVSASNCKVNGVINYQTSAYNGGFLQHITGWAGTPDADDPSKTIIMINIGQ